MTMIVPDKTRAIISLIMLAFILFYMVSLFFFNIPTENKDLVNILLGAVVGRVDSIITYYFAPNTPRRNTNERN